LIEIKKIKFVSLFHFDIVISEKRQAWLCINKIIYFFLFFVLNIFINKENKQNKAFVFVV